MKSKKYIILGSIIILLIIAAVAVYIWNINKSSTESSEKLSKALMNKNLDDLSLTIYYMSPYIATRMPVSVNELQKDMYQYKVTISGRGLMDHSDLLNRLADTELIPIEHEYDKEIMRINARLYYYFETSKDKKIYSVAMWGENESVFVNGIEIEEDEVFYDVIIQFLPEIAVQQFRRYLN